MSFLKYSFIKKNFQRNIYSLTGRWPVSCAYEDQCALRYLKEVENYWKPRLKEKWNQLCDDSDKKKIDRYILSMFPYPSGVLHLGHCRLYTSSDTLARYNLMRGRSVWHPMGWDSFGLPAENAAIQKGVDPAEWTVTNIAQMKSQLDAMGFAFNYMEATSNPSFYKWTQWLFLKLLQNGLAYKSYSLVNWDPVDKTVLAKEQIDENGLSWRSGAKVERRYMKQWFLKTSAFMKELYEATGVDENKLGWKQLLAIQRSWFGKPNCYVFYLKTNDQSVLPVTAEKLEHLAQSDAWLEISSQHWLTQFPDLVPINPVTGKTMSIKVNSDLNSDFYARIKIVKETNSLKEQVIEACKKNPHIGGYEANENFHDWLISRQRYWGTPIPTVDCDSCGTVPLNETQLPLELPKINLKEEKSKELNEPQSRLSEVASEKWLHIKCPHCGNNATRETDTFDTFVDSSWYFLRFASNPMENQAFDNNQKPVWLYLGGNEHAKMHLFYARFIYHFLKKYCILKETNSSEPFEQILFQGMVNSKTFTYKGKYLTLEERSQLLASGVGKKRIEVKYEKMSKSKQNGVDPIGLLNKYGTDATRYSILGSTPSQKTRNWRGEETEFYSNMRTLRKLILTVDQFIYTKLISKENPLSPEVKRFTIKHIKDEKLVESTLIDLQKALDEAVRDVTIAFEYNLRPGAASKKLQEIFDYVKKQSLNSPVNNSLIYSKSLVDIVIMLCPILPHLCEELWAGLRDHWDHKTLESLGYKPNKLCSDQPWPQLSKHYQTCMNINWQNDKGQIQVIKIPVLKETLKEDNRDQFIELTEQKIRDLEELKQYKIRKCLIYDNLHCDIFLESQKGDSLSDMYDEHE